MEASPALDSLLPAQKLLMKMATLDTQRASFVIHAPSTLTTPKAKAPISRLDLRDYCSMRWPGSGILPPRDTAR